MNYVNSKAIKVVTEFRKSALHNHMRIRALQIGRKQRLFCIYVFIVYRPSSIVGPYPFQQLLKQFLLQYWFLFNEIIKVISEERAKCY